MHVQTFISPIPYMSGLKLSRQLNTDQLYQYGVTLQHFGEYQLQAETVGNSRYTYSDMIGRPRKPVPM
jgi:hypothetical protein